MADKYPCISPYAYCAWNPVKLVDPDGREVFQNPYLIFNGKSQIIQIWDDNMTPNDYSDDMLVGQYRAGNNVSLKDNPAGKWEDGIYPMKDTRYPYMHYDQQGNPIMEIHNGKSIPVDSKDGAYGYHGIFHAKQFTQDDGTNRIGMGIHAGRSVSDQNVTKSFTLGCIRVTPDAMEAIVNAINDFGPLTYIIVQNNRSSSKSIDANTIQPGIGLQHIVLNTIHVVEPANNH